MIHTLAAVVLLSAGAVDGRRENIAVHNEMDKWSVPPENLEPMIATIYSVFQKRANIAAAQGQGDATVAKSMIIHFKAVKNFGDFTLGCSKGINRDGFQKMLDNAGNAWGAFPTDSNFKTGCDELFKYLSNDKRSTNGCITDENHLSAVMTYGHVSDRRTAVLKDVFESLTGSVETPLEVGMMPCKEVAKQGMFFSCIHGDCETKDESPVSFPEFKLYYNWLGMFIVDDGQFELMLVNAWHMMGKYAGVNTVNLRMRCYKSDQDQDGEGKLIVLDPDCPSPRAVPEAALEMAQQQNPDEEFVACKY